MKKKERKERKKLALARQFIDEKLQTRANKRASCLQHLQRSRAPSPEPCYENVMPQVSTLPFSEIAACEALPSR
jgi:hypothetical protein